MRVRIGCGDGRELLVLVLVFCEMGMEREAMGMVGLNLWYTLCSTFLVGELPGMKRCTLGNGSLIPTRKDFFSVLNFRSPFKR